MMSCDCFGTTIFEIDGQLAEQQPFFYGESEEKSKGGEECDLEVVETKKRKQQQNQQQTIRKQMLCEPDAMKKVKKAAIFQQTEEYLRLRATVTSQTRIYVFEIFQV